MDPITITILFVIIIVYALYWCVWSNPQSSQNTERPPVRGKIVKERKVAKERPDTDLHPQRGLQRLGLQLLQQGGRGLPISRNPRSRNGRIILYHYTTDHGAMNIKRERLLKSSDQNTQEQHRKYGHGVYFTSYSPHDLEPDKLALNCFTHRQTLVKSSGIYRRTRYIVEIEFDAYEIEKLNIFNRDVYIFRGSINLRQYAGRFRIYENPRHPYDPPYSFYVYSIGMI